MKQLTLFDPKEINIQQGVTKEQSSILDEIRAMEERKHGKDWWKHETLPKKRSKKRRKR